MKNTYRKQTPAQAAKRMKDFVKLQSYDFYCNELRRQNEQIRRQNEQIKRQNEQIKSYIGLIENLMNGKKPQ